MTQFKKLACKLKKFFDFILLKPERIFLTLAIPTCLFSAVFVPQLSEFDGDSHFNAIYTYSDFDFSCDPDNHTVPRAVADKIHSSEGGARGYYGGFAQKVDYTDTVEIRCAGYQPWAYVPQIIGVWMAKLIYPSVGLMVLLARLFSAALFCAAGYFLIRKLKIGKYVLLAVLLIPVIIQQSASVSADASVNLIMLGIIVSILNLFVSQKKAQKSQIIWLLALLVLATLTKLNNLILFLPMIFLPSRLFADNKLKKIPFNVQKWSVALLFGVGFVAAYLVSSLTADGSGGVISAAIDGDVGVWRFLNILYNTYIADMSSVILDETFNQFSSFGYHSPMFILIINIMAILFALLYRNKTETAYAKNISKSLTGVCLATGGLFVVAVSYIMLFAWAKPDVIFADGVQGRYFTALIPLLIPLFVIIQKRFRIEITDQRFAKLMTVLLSIVLLSYMYLTILFIQHDFDFNSGYVSF